MCCGSGGVGKTTTAAVIGLEAANRGLRAVVVTIDPARRLADALGLPDGLGAEPQAIALPEPAGSGELWAMMLDTASAFDGVVRRNAADSRPGRAHPRQSLLPQHLRRIVGHPGVHGGGDAEPAARRRALRPRRGRHAAEPQRPRLPRGAQRARPLPRPPPVPPPDAAGAAGHARRQRRHPADAAGDRQGRRVRCARRRRGVLPGVRRHGGRLPRAGRGGDGTAAVRRHAVRGRRLAAPGHGDRGGLVRRQARRPRHRARGRRRQPRAPGVRAGKRRGCRHRRGDRRRRAVDADLAALWTNLAELRALAAAAAAELAPLVELLGPLADVPLLAGDVHDLEGLGEISRHMFSVV